MDFISTAENYVESYCWPQRSVPSQPLDRIEFLQKLHASLDSRTVFASYGKQLQSCLPLNGIALHHPEVTLKWGHTKGLKLSHTQIVNNRAMQLDYFLSGQLNLAAAHQLDAIEPLLCLPLTNALKHQKVTEQALQDSLTGLSNRYCFDQMLDKAVARTHRGKNHISLLILDLDNFKALNDSKGHQFGDRALINFADIIQKSIRSSDQAFRLGGDEFVILAEGTLDAAIHIALRIAEQTKSSVLLSDNAISSSIGISTLPAGSQLTKDALIAKADAALYTAKTTGRNRYCIAEY